MEPESPHAPDSTTGWSHTAQDAAEAEDARWAAEKSPAPDESPARPGSSTTEPFLERRIGFGNGRLLLVVIVLVVVFFAFIVIMVSHEGGS
jgi:hypothetical protein